MTAAWSNALLFVTLARSTERCVCFSTQCLVNLVWALAVAKVGELDVPLFAAFARQMAERRVGDFNVQQLANIGWAFATVSSSDVHLFAALSRVVELCAGEFNAQGLANMAWAFAKVGNADAALFVVMARAAGRCVNKFKAQELANTAWAVLMYRCLRRWRRRRNDAWASSTRRTSPTHREHLQPWDG